MIEASVFPSDAQRNTDHDFTTPGARSQRADTIAKWIHKRRR
jgi:hypothetical protein